MSIVYSPDDAILLRDFRENLDFEIDQIDSHADFLTLSLM